MIRTASLICTVLILAACNPLSDDSEATSAHEPLVLEVYPVASGMADQIESSLGFLLSGGESGTGRVSILPNGHIAVAAPESMQPGIAALIKKIAESGPVETRQVRIRQWLIEGSSSGQTTIPENLATLEVELLDFAAAAGNMAFERLDTSQHIMLDGKHSNLTSKLLNSSLQARIEAGRILADVSTRAPMLGRVSTEFSVESGQSLVVAQIGKPVGEGEQAEKLIIFAFQAEIL